MTVLEEKVIQSNQYRSNEICKPPVSILRILKNGQQKEKEGCSL